MFAELNDVDILLSTLKGNVGILFYQYIIVVWDAKGFSNAQCINKYFEKHLESKIKLTSMHTYGLYILLVGITFASVFFDGESFSHAD